MNAKRLFAVVQTKAAQRLVYMVNTLQVERCPAVTAQKDFIVQQKNWQHQLSVQMEHTVYQLGWTNVWSVLRERVVCTLTNRL